MSPFFNSSFKALAFFFCRQQFDRLLADYNNRWNPVFIEYFDRHLKKDVVTHAGRWLFQQTGFYNPESGITSNMAESCNKVLKDLRNWRGVGFRPVSYN